MQIGSGHRQAPTPQLPPHLISRSGDGEYTIPWRVHAENLADPARGELTLEVVTEVVSGAAITELDELLRLVGSDETAADEA